MDKLEEKLKRLTPKLRHEVEDYVDRLLSDKIKNKSKFKFNWEGGLSSLPDKFTSVELQHKSSQYR
ncbi:MAG: DUF2281 domain-containing protein [Bacteroidetes bacterium]|nr:DUF2281 domain-containing protein [Bacteroidota bacterium]